MSILNTLKTPAWSEGPIGRQRSRIPIKGNVSPKFADPVDFARCRTRYDATPSRNAAIGIRISRWRRVHSESGSEPKSTGSANFGETFALYRNAAPFGGQWEPALQAAVFSVFNMDTSSKDLSINADYTVGLLSSYRDGAVLRGLFASIIKARIWEMNSFSITVSRWTGSILSFKEIDLKL